MSSGCPARRAPLSFPTRRSSDLTGGDNGLLGIWPAAWLAGPLGYYYLALTACGGGIALLARIGRAPFGLTLRAARDHARDRKSTRLNSSHRCNSYAVLCVKPNPT